jgi:8-oxo-dGTP diphosphatase
MVESAVGPASQGLAKGPRHQVVPRVLIFGRHGKDVLLLKGAPDKKIWPGMYNGIGGHVEAGEDPLLAASREMREESGIDLPVSAFRLSAIISIDMGVENPGISIYVFLADVEDADLSGSEEGMPEWHSLDTLDSIPLVEDLPWLLPKLTSGNSNSMHFLRYSYDETGKLVIEETI